MRRSGLDGRFQRKGSISNAHVGSAFEAKARGFFSKKGLTLKPGIPIKIGINGQKSHRFDLGDEKKKIIIECKAHTWTEGGNVPSAKITTWDQAMFFFYAAPSRYRKILFVQRDYSKKRNQTLAEYYLRTHPHLIPKDVELWEFDEKRGTGKRIR